LILKKSKDCPLFVNQGGQANSNLRSQRDINNKNKNMSKKNNEQEEGEGRQRDQKDGVRKV